MTVTPFPRRGLGRILKWYTFRELIFPTVLSLAGLTALVLTKDLVGFSDLVINRGFGTAVVAWIALYKTVPLIAYTLPFAVLIGTLVGLGRLRADREILSLEAVGVASRRLAGPVCMFAALMTIIGLFFSLYASPRAVRSLETVLQHVAQTNPGAALRPGTVHEFSGVKLAAREISAQGDQLRGVLLWIPDLGHTIFAERGELHSQEGGSALLLLHDVEMLTSPRAGQGGATLRFGTFSTTLQASDSSLTEKERFAGDSTAQIINSLSAVDHGENAAQQALKELHRRFSYPVAILVFGLLAVPLSLGKRRASRAADAIAGLLLVVVYYGLVQLSEGLIQAGVVHVGFGVWLPNITTGAFTVLLLRWDTVRSAWQRRVRERGFPAPMPPHRAGSSLPPRRYLLQRYVLRQYVQMLVISFALLLVGYLLVDILERLEWFARYHTDASTTVRFYGARIPLLASRVVPMALLLATSLTVSIFVARREFVAMRACGISVTRVLAPILLLCGMIAPGYFLLNEVVVPRTNALADRLKETEIKRRSAEPPTVHMAIWYWAGTYVSQVAQLDAKLGEAQGISIYQLGENGLPVSRTDARFARHIGNGIWELTDPTRVEISEQGLRETPASSFIRLGEAPTSAIDTMHFGARRLALAIQEAEEHGYNATKYRVDLHVKLASPLACVLLPAVMLFFAVSGPPFPGPALTLLASIGLGVGYVLFTGVCTSFGYGEVVPPGAAGWGPPALLTVLAGAAAVHDQG